MAENLLTGEGIEIRRLGSFRLKYHKVCPARNPKTDQKLMAKEKYSVRFKPSKELKRAVNETRIQGISANTDSLKPE